MSDPHTAAQLQAHPWHGIPLGDDAPSVLTCFIELVPTDTVKYEIDKGSGHLKVDRPQKFSNVCPAPYGFIPRTLCDARVGARACERTGLEGIRGDQDPLDICVLTERTINHGNILMTVRPIGGLRMIDKHEADDKIVAVLLDDATYGAIEDIRDVPPALIDRLRHYFLTYKDLPDPARLATGQRCEIREVYGVDEAFEVIRRSQQDYALRFGPAK